MKLGENNLKIKKDNKLKILRDYELIYRNYKQNLGKERIVYNNISANELFKQLSSNYLPRCIYYVFDIQSDCITHQKNLHYLGYSQLLNREQIIKSVHKNHQKILPFFLYGLFKILKEEPKYFYDFKYNNILLSLKRAVKYKSDEEKYLYLQQFILPFEFDENGQLISYFNWYIILNEFKGENIEFDVIANEFSFSKENFIPEISLKIKELRFSVLDLLFDKDKEKEIIKLISLGYTTDEIAEKINLGPTTKSRKRAVENRKSNILSIAKEEFPLNNFITAENVVYFLDQQGFINKEKKYFN